MKYPQTMYERMEKGFGKEKAQILCELLEIKAHGNFDEAQEFSEVFVSIIGGEVIDVDDYYKRKTRVMSDETKHKNFEKQLAKLKAKYDIN